MNISSGSTLLNLAFTGEIDKCFKTGRIVNIVGGFSSGKTLLNLSILAEVARNKELKDYRLLYDDAEFRNDFDIEKLFGSKLQERLETPFPNCEEQHSKTTDDFKDSLFEKIMDKKPFIYILDSWDGMTSNADIKKYEKEMESRIKIREGGKGKEVAGTYGMRKAKDAHEIFRMINSQIKKTESILIVVSQAKISVGSIFPCKTRSAERALDFFSSSIIWMSIAQTIKKKDLKIGINTRVKVSKNSLNGVEREVGLTLYYDYGMDDIGANIDFLIERNRWKKSGYSIVADDFDLKGKKETIINYIEENNLETKLAEIVGEVWNKREEEVKLNRKKKYE